MNTTNNTKNLVLDEMLIRECIKVIESTNLGDIARTSYDISLIEATRQRFISNIEKRFNMTKNNF